MTGQDNLIVKTDKISIHMPHTWHDKDCHIAARILVISIHMPHTWHDDNRRGIPALPIHFNPHATYVA